MKIQLRAHIACLVGLGFLALTAYSAQPAATVQKYPHQVLAFYYVWWGNPQVSGHWSHWRDVDENNKTIASTTDYPQLGPYDSHDPKIVDQQFRWAKSAGITGFIVSWWAPGDFHDQGMPLILATAKKYGLKIALDYETVPPADHPQPEGAVKYVLYVLNHYGQHPAWLKVDGKPVIFVYNRGINQIGLEGWRTVKADVNRQYPGGAFFIGHHVDQLTEAARIFDGLHDYNPTDKITGMSVAQIREWAQANYPQWVQLAGSDRLSTVTVIPGYNDIKNMGVRPNLPLTTDRHNGETYRVLWEEAIAAHPDWILVTSWNEWHEGSEIEPSVQYGDQYLKATAGFTAKFLKSPLRAAPASR
jgi:hypothetical protein